MYLAGLNKEVFSMGKGKTVGTNGKVTKPYLVPDFMRSNVSSLSVYCLSLAVSYEFLGDNTSGIGRLENGHKSRRTLFTQAISCQ